MSIMPNDEDETLVERLLRLSVAEPAWRARFVAELMESSVLVLGHPDPQAGDTTPGTRLALHQWETEAGEVVLPFFTSPAALRRAVDEDVEAFSLPARSLFRAARGMKLLLNPGSAYGKEFLPEETETLLTQGPAPMPASRRVPAGTPLHLAPPAETPVALIDALTTLFARHPNVIAAWLVSLEDPSSEGAPRLLIALDAEGEVGELIREAGVVANETAKAEDAVDLLRLDPHETLLHEHLRDTLPPFYERSWGARLFSGEVGHA